MMNCPYCQETLMPQDQFCIKCGRPRPTVLGAASNPSQPARARNTKKTLVLVALSVGLIAAIIGTGVFVYAATRPNPVLTLTSAYHVNGIPAGGSVCGENEGGLPFVTHSTFSEGNLVGTAYKETFVETCSGTYRGGKLEENVTVTSQYLSYTDSSSNDVICSPSVPYVYEQIQGTFSSATVISGTYNIASARLTCTNAFETFTQYAEAGSWNGTVSSM